MINIVREDYWYSLNLKGISRRANIDIPITYSYSVRINLIDVTCSGNARREIDFFLSLSFSLGRSLSRYRELDPRQTWLTEWQTNAYIERRAGCTRLTTRGRCVAYKNRFDRYTYTECPRCGSRNALRSIS